MCRITDRINDYIQYRGMSIRAFEGGADIKYSTISAAIKRGTELNTATLLKIIDTYDDINIDWLMTGEGPMLKADQPEEIESVELCVEPEIRMHPHKVHTCSEDFTYTDNDNAGKVPIITEQGFAHYDREDLTKLIVEDYYYIKEFRNADFMLRITGDAMHPRYKSGDLLACRNIDMQTFWQWGKVHAVLTCNQGLIIRRVMPGDNCKVILMKADNPAYPDYRILLEEILTSAIVIGSISMD